MNMRIIDDITNFLFVEDRLEKADAIFVPGGSYPELPERAAALWKEGYAPWVVPSGRYSVTIGKFTGLKSQAEKYSGDYATECEFYTEVLQANGVDQGSILKEDRAQYTAQNAIFTRELLDAGGIYPQKAILCCKGYHARRCLMYYQFSFPDTAFLVAPVDITVGKESWYRTEHGLKKVLGELERLGTQFGPEYDRFREPPCNS